MRAAAALSVGATRCLSPRRRFACRSGPTQCRAGAEADRGMNCSRRARRGTRRWVCIVMACGGRSTVFVCHPARGCHLKPGSAYRFRWPRNTFPMRRHHRRRRRRGGVKRRRRRAEPSTPSPTPCEAHRDINGSMHMKILTKVWIELCCNGRQWGGGADEVFSTQDHSVAGIAKDGTATVVAGRATRLPVVMVH